MLFKICLCRFESNTLLVIFFFSFFFFCSVGTPFSALLSSNTVRQITVSHHCLFSCKIFTEMEKVSREGAVKRILRFFLPPLSSFAAFYVINLPSIFSAVFFIYLFISIYQISSFLLFLLDLTIFFFFNSRPFPKMPRG